MATWLDLVKNVFSIKTGDGATYSPKSFNANLAVEYNMAEFTFRNLDGTLVDRRSPMGAVYNLELYFEGGDCIKIAKKFRKSCNNTKPWQIAHQFYGNINVQPITPVQYDNANNLLNVTKITCTVRETIGGAQITTTESPVDVITAGQKNTSEHYAEYYVTEVPEPTVRDVQQMQSDISGFKKALNTVSAGANDLQNAYNQAYYSTLNAIHDVSGAIGTIQYYLSLPATIAGDVLSRIGYIESELESLWDQVLSLHIPSLKALWFTKAGTAVSAMCLAAITDIQPTDYVYANDVLTAVSKITTAYNRYIQSIDVLQTPTNTTVADWAPQFNTIILLESVVYLTITTLFDIQTQAKQPKYITLNRDNNVINIAWQIYGLLADDSTIDRIITDNDLRGIDLIQVPKGRQILYYQ